MKLFIFIALLLTFLDYAGNALMSAGFTYWPVVGFIMYGVVSVYAAYLVYLVVGRKVKRRVAK